MFTNIKGSVILLLIAINTLAWCLPLFLFAIIRFFAPSSARPWCTRRAMNIAECWITCNNLFLRLTGVTPIQVANLPALDADKWYLVISNHQAWSDIFILQYVFNRRIPMLKFFIKQQLIYVPVIGIAWWALDFPIMKRYSRAQLEKDPSLKGRDLETTRRSCEHFKLTPVSVLNFLEGTRFTPEKHASSGSPFTNLLRPKTGGASLVLGTLKDKLDAIIDVTISYPSGAPSLMAFLAGEAGEVRVSVRRLPVPGHIPFDDYDVDKAARDSVQAYFNELWQYKDRQLQADRQL